ncbi:MAG: glycosyltransferase family 4 protein [Phycisphaerae bacterium]|jgi:glycosyltransferase involved in cell wall biosynthesis
MKPITVMQLVPRLEQGGVERGVVEFSRELIKRGHRSIVVSASGRLVEQIATDGGKHITFDVCSKNPLTAAARIERLRRIIMREKPDILHPRSRVPAWMCWLAMKFMRERPRLVTTVHGFNSISAYSKVMLAGERVIYSSGAVKDYVCANYRFDESKLRYVPRGIDMSYFDPEKIDKSFIADFKQQHGLDGRLVVSIVGRITQWKGHTDFIKAIGRVRRSSPNVLGLIVGRTAGNKDEYFTELKKMAEELGGAEAFRFAGPQKNVREIYALSDIVVSAASSKPETFGRIAAEAMAMNTPVVGSAQGGTLDIIKDGEFGLLFEPGNSEMLAEKISEALAANFADFRGYINDHFSLEIMTESELAVYEELINDS